LLQIIVSLKAIFSCSSNKLARHKLGFAVVFYQGEGRLGRDIRSRRGSSTAETNQPFQAGRDLQEASVFQRGVL
jgi:hypothetical protein